MSDAMWVGVAASGGAIAAVVLALIEYLTRREWPRPVTPDAWWWSRVGNTPALCMSRPLSNEQADAIREAFRQLMTPPPAHDRWRRALQGMKE